MIGRWKTLVVVVVKGGYWREVGWLATESRWKLSVQAAVRWSSDDESFFLVCKKLQKKFSCECQVQCHENFDHNFGEIMVLAERKGFFF